MLDTAAYEAILRHGKVALAWEVLRRDPRYCAAYALLKNSRADAIIPAGFVADWGLHFP